MNFESQKSIATDDDQNSVSLGNEDIDLGPKKKNSIICASPKIYKNNKSEDAIENLFMDEDKSKYDKYLNYTKQKSPIKSFFNKSKDKKKDKEKSAVSTIISPSRAIKNILSQKRSVDAHGEEVGYNNYNNNTNIPADKADNNIDGNIGNINGEKNNNLNDSNINNANNATKMTSGKTVFTKVLLIY